METKKNDSLVEFELQDSQLNDVMGGQCQKVGLSGPGIYNGLYCEGDLITGTAITGQHCH